MTTLFNLCEYEYILEWKKIYSFLSLPIVSTRYNKSEKEIYDYYWAAYEISGDPDDIPF